MKIKVDYTIYDVAKTKDDNLYVEDNITEYPRYCLIDWANNNHIKKDITFMDEHNFRTGIIKDCQITRNENEFIIRVTNDIQTRR